MSRSKHTDPSWLKATRRIRAPHDARGVGDLSRRRQFGLTSKVAGVLADRGGDPLPRKGPGLRVIVRTPRPGFFHPAGKQDIVRVLKRLGPIAIYGLERVELSQSGGLAAAPLFGRYFTPGRIVLYEQALPPWRLPGLMKQQARLRLERAGAVVTLSSEVGATQVDWPGETLRRFMVEEVLLHELGHHVLQHYKGKRTERVARKRDHEFFAERFARKQQSGPMKGNGS